MKAAVAGSLGRSLTHLLTVTDDQPTNQELTHFAPVSQSACCSNCETAFGRSVGRSVSSVSVSQSVVGHITHSRTLRARTLTFPALCSAFLPSFLPSFFFPSFLPSLLRCLLFLLRFLTYFLLACCARAVRCCCWWWGGGSGAGAGGSVVVAVVKLSSKQ